MSALASSAVTRNNTYYEGGTNARKHKVVDVTMVLTGQGTAANAISASVLGLRLIARAHSIRSSDDTLILLGTPSYDGTKLLLKAAGTAAPADATGTFKAVVMGVE